MMYCEKILRGSNFFFKHILLAFSPKLIFHFFWQVIFVSKFFPWVLFSFRNTTLRYRVAAHPSCCRGQGTYVAVLLTGLWFREQGRLEKGRWRAIGWRLIFISTQCWRQTHVETNAGTALSTLSPWGLSSTRDGYSGGISGACYHALRVSSYDTDFNGLMLPGRSLMSTQPRNRRASL